MDASTCIEPDASAASYFFALAALTGGTITVQGLGPASLQGDLAFVDILEHMGCTVRRDPGQTTVTGGPLRAVDVDMNAISDTVMTMAVVALFADGVTRIRNIGHIRHKETDRIAALAVELRKLGARVDELPDGLIIEPPALSRLQPARIDDLRRPPHGHGVRSRGSEDSRRHDPRPGLRRQDLSGVLGRSGSRAIFLRRPRVLMLPGPAEGDLGAKLGGAVECTGVELDVVCPGMLAAENRHIVFETVLKRP